MLLQGIALSFIFLRALYKKIWGREIARVLIAPGSPFYDLQCIVGIKIRSDLLVQVTVNNLTFLFLFAFSCVTNIVGKFCFDTINFELSFT